MILFDITLVVFFGIVMYLIRCRAQLVYGIVEVVAALVVVYLAFRPPYSVLVIEQGYSPWGVQLQHYYGLLAGVYIFVRGMDNIGSALPRQLRVRWDRLFRGPSLPQSTNAP
jgi:hypothetical protein